MDTLPYVNGIVSTGSRAVSTNAVSLSVSMNWLNGQGGPDDDLEITVTVTVLTDMNFSYPDGVPDKILPGEETTFGVNVEGVGDGVPVPGSGLLHYSVNGGAYVSVGMAEPVPNEYEAVLPAINCDESLDFYVSVEEQADGIFYDHLDSPFHAIPINIVDTVFTDSFETDLGWKSSGGLWARGGPTGGGGQYGSPDPVGGHLSGNVIGYNLSGDYTNNMPEYNMTSPSIDCSGMTNMELRFWRWLGVEESAYDHAYIRISTDGTSWSTVWENTATVADSAWHEQVYDISSYADGQATVYIRFTMGVSDAGWVFCGWNIDDLALVGYACEVAGLTIATGSLPDWTVGYPYSQTLTCVNQTGNVVWADRDGDLVGTGLSVSTDGVVSGTPTSSGYVSFVAQVTDETPDTAEKTFTFLISPPVEVTTTLLGYGTEGAGYAQQLESSGGTDPMIWSDLNGDLDGTGLTLSDTGLLSGVPIAAGAISFTAVVTDVAGSQDQQELTANINPPVVITTTTLPESYDGQPYSSVLAATGGTGAIGWTEVGDVLSGAGLSLSVSGVIDGTPNGPQTINFTVVATDQLGSTDESALTIQVNPAYLCGDITNNGVGPNIEDLIYLVTFMFQDGPPPPIMLSTDVDGNDQGPDIADLIYLVNFMFNEGPDLICDDVVLASPEVSVSKSMRTTD